MPDHTLPVADQLEQAISIIRSHIKLLAEAKIHSDMSKKRIDELEAAKRKMEYEVNIRDKAITELRLRLPATADRDFLVQSALNPNNELSNTPVKAVQATIESLQVNKFAKFLYYCH
jgi:centrosomal protein CEP290